MRSWLIVLSTLVLTAAVPLAAPAQNLPARPAVLLDTAYAAPVGGTIITVNAGDDLQAALDGAQPGDIVELAAGASFTGNFILPSKPGTGWIYIRSSAVASLPAPGTRVSPTDAGLMPRIISPNTMPALLGDFGAHHYRLVGIEITATLTTLDSTVQNLVLFGFRADGTPATSIDQLPHDIVFDRCYVHGTTTGDILRGIALNAASSAVVDSYLAEFHHDGADSQAIAVWNGAGPLAIRNNYLQAAAENLLFGGASPTIANLVASDIEVRHNHFFKPLTWKPDDPSYAGILWVVKNLLELKNVQRIVVDGNLFENVWPAAQAGFALQFTVRNDDGTAPWSIVQDVTFTHNVVRHVGGGVNISGFDDNAPSLQAQRLLVQDNVFEDVGTVAADARLFQILDDAADVTIDHNTTFHVGPTISADAAPAATGFTFTNNIAPESEGVVGSGTAVGLDTLTTFFPGFAYRRNVQPGGDPAIYPPDNFFPPTLGDVGFVDLAGGDYTLSSLSAFKNAGTDGKDIGADIAAVTAATAGAEDGGSSTPAPPPPVTVAITQPAAGATVHDLVPVTAVTTGSGVVSVTFTLDGAPVGPTLSAPPYTFSLNTRPVPNGPHTLSTFARDGASQVLASASISVVVVNPLPTVRIVTPKDGATVKGDVKVEAAVTRSPSVASLQFELNGQNVGAALTAPAYELRWSTSGVPNGSYTLQAAITTVAGESVTSDAVRVAVANPVPSVRIATPHGGATVRGDVRVEAVLSNVTGFATLQFQLDGRNLGEALTRAPHAIAWNTRTSLGGPHTLLAIVTTTGGATIVSDPVTVVVANPPPTVRITRPTAGATVKGDIELRAAVSHRRAIASLQFRLDDHDFAPLLTGPEWAVPWNTLTAADGAHTVRAVIVTLAGVTITSDPVAFVVSNPLPTVRITKPSTGDTVKGKVQVRAAVTERQRVTSLQFQLDGRNLGPAITSGDLGVDWDADAAVAGQHTLTAVITITGGGPITSAPVTVTSVKKK